jgi:poly(A) polymerase
VSDAELALAALARQGTEGWLVGGAVRDRRLGRPTQDLDVAVRGDPARLSRAVARELHAHRFALSEQFGAWRVISGEGSWQLDITRLLGETIEADLAQRDLTINAIAEPLGGGRPVDPFGGHEDLRSRRLRMVSSEAFRADPLRALRVARLRAELGFEIDPATARAARGAAPGLSAVAPERQFAELRRLLAADGALDGLAATESLGVTALVLPELAALHGIEQSRFHHLDVHDHTLAVLREAIVLQRDPEARFPGLGAPLRALLAEPLAGGVTRGEALRFGALLHDVAKPQTRSVTDAGRVTFIGHDEQGAELARAVLTRLRAGERVAEHVGALARHHLRLGFLVHSAPLGARARYAYLKACGPVGVDVTLLSVADRLATRGEGSEEAIARHLELARAMLPEALRWRAAPPRPPVRGDRLASALALAHGPELGRVLAELEAASYAGEVADEQQAIEHARRWLGR